MTNLDNAPPFWHIVSDLVRNAQGRIAQFIRKVGEAQVYTSIIVPGIALRQHKERVAAACCTARESPRPCKSCLSKRLPTPRRVHFEFFLRKAASGSGRMICSLLPKRSPWIWFLYLTTNATLLALIASRLSHRHPYEGTRHTPDLHSGHGLS